MLMLNRSLRLRGIVAVLLLATTGVLSVGSFFNTPVANAFEVNFGDYSVNCSLSYDEVRPVISIAAPDGLAGDIDNVSDWEDLVGRNFTQEDFDIANDNDDNPQYEFGVHVICTDQSAPVYGWLFPTSDPATFIGGFGPGGPEGLGVMDDAGTLYGLMTVRVPDTENPEFVDVEYVDNPDNEGVTFAGTLEFNDEQVDILANPNATAALFPDAGGGDPDDPDNPPGAETGVFRDVANIVYNGETYTDSDWSAETSNDQRYYLTATPTPEREPLIGVEIDCRPYIQVDWAVHLDGSGPYGDDLNNDFNSALSSDDFTLHNRNTSCGEFPERDIPVNVANANVFFELALADDTVRTIYSEGESNENMYIGVYSLADGGAPNTFYQDPSDTNFSPSIEIPGANSATDGDVLDVTFNMSAGGNSQGVATVLRARVVNEATVVTIDAPADDDSGVADPTCESSNPALGWFLCPVAEKLLDVLESTLRDGVVKDTLTFSSLESGTTQRDSLQNVWVGFRTLANAGFIIAFFMFVYSAITGGVLSAYDIKKLAPKLVVGAIAVQMSLFICIMLVDIFNALGTGIVDIMLSPLPGGSGASGIDGVFPSEAALNTNALSSALGGVVSSLVLIFIIVGVLFSLIGVFIMIVVFLIRNMALIILTVISPLAFVCWILPNTESLFRKWWGFYTQLLALFPIAMAFLASGRLISYVWSNGSDSWANVWLGMIALFLPYVIAPKMFQFAGSAINGIVRGVDSAKSTISQRGKQGVGFAANSRVGKKVRAGQTMSGDSRLSKAINKAGQAATNPTAVIGGKKGRERRQARASSRYDETVREDERAAEINLGKDIAGLDDAARQTRLRQISMDGSATNEKRAAAMKRMIVDNDFDGIERAMIDISGSASGRATVDRFKQENASDLAGKARHLLTANTDSLRNGNNAHGASRLATADGGQLASQHANSIRAAVSQMQASGNHTDMQQMVETYDALDDQAKARMSRDAKDQIELARSNVLAVNPGAMHLMPTAPADIAAHNDSVRRAQGAYTRSGRAGMGLDQP